MITEQDIRVRLSANTSDFDEVISDALQLIVDLKIKVEEFEKESSGGSYTKSSDKSKLLVQTEKEVTSDKARIEINNVRIAMKHLLNFEKEDDEENEKNKRRRREEEYEKYQINAKNVTIKKSKSSKKSSDKNIKIRPGKYNRRKKPKSGHVYIYKHVYEYKNVQTVRWRFVYDPHNKCNMRINKTFATIKEAVERRDKYLGGKKID